MQLPHVKATESSPPTHETNADDNAPGGPSATQWRPRDLTSNTSSSASAAITEERETPDGTETNNLDVQATLVCALAALSLVSNAAEEPWRRAPPATSPPRTPVEVPSHSAERKHPQTATRGRHVSPQRQQNSTTQTGTSPKGPANLQLLSDMPLSVQRAAASLQDVMREDFRRRPRPLEEVFFEDRRRYRLIHNSSREWKAIELPWLPPAMRGARRTRDTEVPRALLQAVHLNSNPATTQSDFQFFSKADLIQSPSGHRITDLPTKVRLNAARLITRMFAEL